MNGGDGIRIENVVASAMVSHRLDISNILKHLPEAEYEPDRFPALLYHQNQPRSLIILFNNGKLICTGLGSIVDTGDVMHDLVRRLEECGEAIFDTYRVEVESIIASADMGKKLDIEVLYKNRALPNAELSTEEVKALVYRPPFEGITCLIFPSGRIAFTGAKDVEQVERVYGEIRARLCL